jgi:hypothetical protein
MVFSVEGSEVVGVPCGLGGTASPFPALLAGITLDG